MTLNPNIILQGQMANPVAAAAQGAQTGQMMNDFQQTNALRDMYRQHGAGIAQGNQQSLNALASLDPQAALGIQDTRLGMDRSRQAMRHADANQARLSRQEQRAIEAQAAQMSAADRTAEAQRIEQAVAAGLQARTPEEWDAFVSSVAPDLVGQFENREMIAGRFLSIADSLKRFDEMNAPEMGADLPASVRALQFRAEQAGLKPGTPEYMQFMADGGSKSGGFFMETRPDGTQVISMNGAPESDGRMSPSDPQAMLNSIEGILNDPNLDTSTGVLSFLQNLPGTPQRAFGARANQLEGQAFLQAFESLKGAGQITEIEGLKATQAIGRLDTAQSPDDYRAALNDLKEVLLAAQGRSPGQQPAQERSPAAPVTIDGYTITVVE